MRKFFVHQDTSQQEAQTFSCRLASAKTLTNVLQCLNDSGQKDQLALCVINVDGLSWSLGWFWRCLFVFWLRSKEQTSSSKWDVRVLRRVPSCVHLCIFTRLLDPSLKLEHNKIMLDQALGSPLKIWGSVFRQTFIFRRRFLKNLSMVNTMNVWSFESVYHYC